MLLSGSPLSPPANLSATALDDNTVELHWDATAAAETGLAYEIDRDNGTGWNLVATVDPTTDGDTTLDSTVVGDNNYAYRARTTDPANPTNASIYTDQVNVITPFTTPDAPVITAATSTTPGQVDLAWYSASPIVTAFEVRAVPVNNAPVLYRRVPAFATDYAFDGLTPNLSYGFVVVAINQQGPWEERWSDRSEVVSAYAHPVALSATAPAAVPEGNTFPLTLASGGSPSPVNSWTLAYNDQSYPTTYNGPAGTAYHFVSPGLTVNVTANTANGGPAYVLPPIHVDVIPSAPSDVTATVISATEIDLAWTNNSHVADGIRVYRAESGSGNFVPVADLPADAQTYADIWTVAGTQYDYQVRSICGTTSQTQSSPASPASPVTTPDHPHVTMTNLNVVPNGDGATRQIDFGWFYAGVGDEAAIGYEVERQQLTGRWPVENYATRQWGDAGALETDSPTGGTYSFAGESDQPFEGEQFQFRVRADLANGTVTDYAETAPITAAAIAPGMHAENDPTGNSATRLTWTYAAADPYGFEVQVRRDDSPLWESGIGYNNRTTTGGTKEYVAPGFAGLKYHYRVRAISAPPQSGPSHPSVWSAEVEWTVPGRTDWPVGHEYYNLQESIQRPTVSYTPVDDHTISVTWGNIGYTTGFYHDHVSPNTVNVAVYDEFTDPTRPLVHTPGTAIGYVGGYGFAPGQTSALFTVTPGKPFVVLLQISGDPSYSDDASKHLLDLGVTGMASIRGIVGKATPLLPAVPRLASAYWVSERRGIVGLWWTNNPNNESGYEVYRSSGTSGFDPNKSVFVDRVGSDITSLIDNNAKAGETNYYGVYSVIDNADENAGPPSTQPTTQPSTSPSTAPASRPTSQPAVADTSDLVASITHYLTTVPHKISDANVVEVLEKIAGDDITADQRDTYAEQLGQFVSDDPSLRKDLFAYLVKHPDPELESRINIACHGHAVDDDGFMYNPDEFFSFETTEEISALGVSSTKVDFHIARLSDDVGVAYISLIPNDVVNADPPVAKLEFHYLYNVAETLKANGDYNQDADATMYLTPNHVGKAKLKIEYEFYAPGADLIGVSKPTSKLIRYLEVDVAKR